MSGSGSTSRASMTTGRCRSPHRESSSIASRRQSLRDGQALPGVPTLRRDSLLVHLSGRTICHSTGTLAFSEAIQTPRTYWRCTVFPDPGTNVLRTPTECSPAFWMTSGSTTHATGATALSAYRASSLLTSFQSHVELVMKWCGFCSAEDIPALLAILRMDFLPAVVRRPLTYTSPHSRCRLLRNGEKAVSQTCSTSLSDG